MRTPQTMTNYNCDFSTSSFTESGAYYKLLGFLEDINHDIIVRKICRKNDNVHALLERVERIINETQLEEGSFRFANGAAVKVYKNIEKIDFSKYFKLEKKYLIMLKNYFINSFGNKSRLDYGTGHEITFLAFLYVLKETSILRDSQIKLLFKKYFQIVRLFIYKFNIEPAGSNGMFAVDDYSFLPFLFGSAENFHSRVKLEQILDVLEERDCFNGDQDDLTKSISESGERVYENNEENTVKNNEKEPPSSKLNDQRDSEKTDDSLRSDLDQSLHSDLNATQSESGLGLNADGVSSVNSESTIGDHKEIVDPFNGLYAEAIQFCIKHKCKLVSRPFSKHSPILYSLRHLSWSQINEKMLEEVINKVLDRFVVMQHFIFCEVLPK